MANLGILGQCGRHHYHSDYNLKLAEGLSYFDREVGKMSAQPPYINYACILSRENDHSLLILLTECKT